MIIGMAQESSDRESLSPVMGWALAELVKAEAELKRPASSLLPAQRCSGRWKGCVKPEGHDGECLDKNGDPARWSDPTYLGDGPWGA